MNINVKQLNESLKRLPIPVDLGQVYRVSLKERFIDHADYDNPHDTVDASIILNLVAVKVVNPYGHQSLEWELVCP